MNGQLLGKNRNAKVARLNALNYTKLENYYDFIHRRARPQCILDVPAHAGGGRVSVGRLESDAEQLNILNRQNATRVDSGGYGHELIN
jgi:hypothetical protein